MSMLPYKYICVEGNIGAGKTSFCQKVKSENNCKLILEQFADNPFLPLFYNEPERYAFTVELFFMTERFKQLQAELSQDLFYDFTISDYTFVKTLLFAKKNLPDNEFSLFQKMYNILAQTFPAPDLLVYFHRDINVLQSNIAKRGRKYETSIANQYLLGIQNAYFEYFRNVLTIPILIIDLQNIDFINNRANYDEIIALLYRQYKPGVHRISLSL
jgi:deoxyadenosine/deoxycytidine kinase